MQRVTDAGQLGCLLVWNLKKSGCVTQRGWASLLALTPVRHARAQVPAAQLACQASCGDGR